MFCVVALAFPAWSAVPSGNVMAVATDGIDVGVRRDSPKTHGASRAGFREDRLRLSGISRRQASKIPPGPPEPVDVNVTRGLRTISWWGTRIDILVSYKVYRRCADRTWRLVASVAVRKPNSGRYELVDSDSPDDCEFSVSAFDHYGNEGPRSQPAK